MTATEGGPYSGKFATSIPDVYTLRVRAQGETVYGSPFTREQTVTALTVPGGGRERRQPSHEGLPTIREVSPEAIRILRAWLDQVREGD